MKRLVTVWCGAALWAALGLAQADRRAKVDAAGVLRWTDDGSEVALLGVNYYAPFTIDFAGIQAMGLDHRRVIRDDAAHFRRLGLGCVRIHCFDREFSDAEGNVLDNAHLELLDAALDAFRSNGLYTVLTPIAWWGNMHSATHGFSDLYTMPQMTTDRDAWVPQARFLRAFAEHTNRFTGKRYADDPCVLAFECINEPLYPKETPDTLVTAYINALADALRASGTAKPIYYNSWQGRNAAAAAARLNGVTCSVYPTGLASGRALRGSQLCRAQGSSLRPDASLARLSRMVYEFDAADVPGSHMYPSMAKFFRSEGIQVASQFQYDPLPLAAVNRNWMTHHLNLVYTPGKALSLAIAAEVFRRVPRGAAFGRLPEAAVFPPFRSSGEEDLSELAAEDAYLSSSATATPAPRPEALTRVWGCGPSPLVDYRGTGAYFLDRAAPGVWRLQLYPDVFTVADPYTGSPEIKVRLLPTRHPLRVKLPDLGEAFSVWRFADGTPSEPRPTASAAGAFEATPGDYLLTRTSARPSDAALRAAARIAPPFVAPEPEPAGAPLLRAEVPVQWRDGVPLPLRAACALATNVSVLLSSAAGDRLTVPLALSDGGACSGAIPGSALAPGVWQVTLLASGPAGTALYPTATDPDARPAPAAGTAIPLLSLPASPGVAPQLEVYRGGFRTTEVAYAEGREAGARALRLVAEGLGRQGSASGFSLPLPARVADEPKAAFGLKVVARAGRGGARCELGFRMRDGHGVGYTLNLSPGWSETVIPEAELMPLWGLASRGAFRWSDVERLSVLTGAWLLAQGNADGVDLTLAAVERVRLEPGYPLRVVGESEAWSLFDAAAWLRAPEWTQTLWRWLAADGAGNSALHLEATTFAGESESLSLRAPCDGKTFAQLWRTDGERAALHVRARATTPRTTGFELVLIESDGVPWGTVVPLSPEWREVRIPLSELRLFTHWDADTAKRAGARLRLSKLESLNICFGRWLYPDAAAQHHAFEISAIGVTAQ